jgi:hypothetical protein
VVLTLCRCIVIFHLAAIALLACGAEREAEESAARTPSKPPPVAFRWPLEDRSELLALADPWPAQAEVPSVVRIIARSGSWGVRLVERADLQLSGSPHPVDHWRPMQRARDDGRSLVLEAQVQLPAGPTFVHVRIHKHGGAGSEVLAPWRLEVQRAGS